jgi:hypothetical protein
MILDDLVKAIEQGKPLRVRYFGGSSPGGERELQPLSVKDGKVRARCLSSGATKTFAIEKMELATDGMTSVLAVSLPAPAPLYPTVHEFVSGRSALFYELGWIVLHDGNTLSLNRKFKNGKPIKTPDVELQFEAVAYELVFNGDEVVEANHRDRLRPWVIRARDQNTKTFGDFGKAQLTFVEFAKLLAPNAAKKFDAPRQSAPWFHTR